MSDPDLIVPVRVNALVVNTQSQISQNFQRWSPRFQDAIAKSGPAEPMQARTTAPLLGVQVQWEIPESLATGHYDQKDGETTFPLVPNRWLVVRYSGPKDNRRAAGWVVHSDFLQQYDPANRRGTSEFLDPWAPADEPRRAYIGRKHQLTADAPWEETEAVAGPPPRELFLTAIGPGLPAFAAYSEYHQDVFCLYEPDTTLPVVGDDDPPEKLSYLVVGWYSQDEGDILKRAHEIPGLIPPPSEDPDEAVEGVAAVLKGLGWAVPGASDSDVRGRERTLYVGMCFGVEWKLNNFAPPTDKPAHGDDIKVAVGHSTADAVGALAAAQTSSVFTGDVLRALFEGTVDTFDTAEGDQDLDEATRRAWFCGHDSGHAWRIVPRAAAVDGESARSARASRTPDWLSTLNRKQAEYDRLAPRLAQAQWRLWSIWWLRRQTSVTPPGDFNARADQLLDAHSPDSLAAEVARQAAAVKDLIDYLPHGADPEALQRSIDAFLRDKDLPADLALQRVAREPFHKPADPVVLLDGAQSPRPLTRDAEDPLPCRLPSQLLRTLRINGVPVDAPALPPAPNPANLPINRVPILAEFALLDQALLTPATDTSHGPTALHAIAAAPQEHGVPEYTAGWKQAWLPMFLQWTLKYCPTPYVSEGAEHWTFNGEDYDWNGDNAQRGTGEGDLRWLYFTGRTYLTPSAQYVEREQIRRLLQTYPSEDDGVLRALREDLDGLDQLSQSLDGFNDWLLQQDGAARFNPSGDIGRAVGDQGAVPVPQTVEPSDPEDATPAEDWFQPVRAGTFFFRELMIIDRFGQTVHIARPAQEHYKTLTPRRSPSVTPTAGTQLSPTFGQVRRLIQLPPRLMQEARVRLETVAASDGAAFAAGPTALDAVSDTSPVAGWLMLNYLDRTLLVYAPSGAPLGELRVVVTESGSEETAWNPLPHSPHADPASPGFTGEFPHLAGFLARLIGPYPERFRDLITTIDGTFDSVIEPSASQDRSPARLIGRPVVLMRVDLALQLRGQPMIRPGWENILTPEPEPFPDYRWPVRLGDPAMLDDGLIGYYAGESGADSPVSYDTLRAVSPTDDADSGYVVGIDPQELELPARPDERAVTHHLTVLADPHNPVHATTGILPVTSVRLPAEVVQAALGRIRASFRLNPLLAPDRIPVEEELRRLREGGDAQPEIVLPPPARWHGQWTWAEPRAGALDVPDWLEQALAPADTRYHPDDSVPTARAGYLQLRPVVPDGE